MEIVGVGIVVVVDEFCLWYGCVDVDEFYIWMFGCEVVVYLVIGLLFFLCVGGDVVVDWDVKDE